MTKIVTGWREWTDNAGSAYRTRVTYGFDEEFAARNNQAPHFSMTCETQRIERGRWREDSFGAIHTEVVRHFPELEPLVRWHLVDTVRGPMHYEENAIFWWQEGQSGWGTRSRGVMPLEAFKNTVVYGVVDGDEAFDPTLCFKQHELRAWLQNRFPALMEAFRRDLERLGVRVPAQNTRTLEP